ncbi:hypothetical protein [Streptomyces sp. NPDC003943]
MAAAIRARVVAVVDKALAAADVAATVFVMNDGGRFHRRHLLAEARRHLALVLDEKIVAAAVSTPCLDISEPTTTIGLLLDYRLYTARWSGRSCAPPPSLCGAGRTTSSPTSRRRCPSSCSRPSRPTPNTTTRSRGPAAEMRWT